MEDVTPVVQAHGLWAEIVALARYMARTEVHTYAFSVAANVILSLFPFIVLLLTISRNVFHSRSMEAVVGDMMRSLLPVGQDFVMRNMQLLAHPHKGTQFFSVVMLLITSTGVFLPLEVALNRVWGVRQNRSYLHNQAVSLGLAFAVGVLAMASVASTASQQTILSWVFFEHTDNVRLPLHLVWFFAAMRRSREHPPVLPDLLGAALQKNSRTSRSPHCDCDRDVVATGEGPLYQGVAVAGLSVGVRSVLYFGRVDDVGVSLRSAVARRGAFFGHTLYLEAGAAGGGGGGGT